jgi:hypothetical protein
LGDPIVCPGFDLEEGLRRENTARMAHEDGLVSDSDDNGVKIEEATSQPIPGATKSVSPLFLPLPPASAVP